MLDPALLRFTVLVVLGRWHELGALRRGLSESPGRAWREALLQAHLFAGFPRIVEAFGVLEQAGGMGTPGPDEVLAEPDRPDLGAALFARIYGRGAGAVQAGLVAHHPDFAGWILGHAYGRVLARPGLEPAERELLAVVALAALGQERQLASHARGAVALGAPPAEVHGALAAVADLLGPTLTADGQRVLERFARPPAGGAP